MKRLGDVFNVGFSEPAKPKKVIPELREDYIKAYKTYFMHTGDHQIAKELGLLELRRSWAETNTDGSGRLTKHAPELEYPSLSADAIKQRFETDLTAQGFDPETTFLRTDDQTRTESKTMHPTYALTVNGEALTLPDGAALRWKPNEGLFQVAAANEDDTEDDEEDFDPDDYDPDDEEGSDDEGDFDPDDYDPDDEESGDDEGDFDPDGFDPDDEEESGDDGGDFDPDGYDPDDEEEDGNNGDDKDKKYDSKCIDYRLRMENLGKELNKLEPEINALEQGKDKDVGQKEQAIEKIQLRLKLVESEIALILPRQKLTKNPIEATKLALELAPKLAERARLKKKIKGLEDEIEELQVSRESRLDQLRIKSKNRYSQIDKIAKKAEANGCK